MTPAQGIHRSDPSRPPWRLETVAETGSTNDDLLRAAERGDLADRSVLRTGHQTSGRGRLSRRWDAPPGSNLLASIYLAEPGSRPITSVQRVGVAIVEALADLAAGECDVGPGSATALGLKWPNDVLLGGRKLAGILAQRSTGAQGLVVGFGVNVGWAPTDAARTTEITDRRPDELLDAVLAAFDALPTDERAFADRYRGHLLTLGQQVRIHLPDGSTFDGLATGVDVEGRIIVRSADGAERTFDVGDVVHLRPGPPGPT